jgi:peroxiredoxin (alkyl hydroperoxide reductase subunit C)
MKRKIVFICSLMILLGLLVNLGGQKMNEPPVMPLIGDPFPAIEVQTTHGKMKIPEAFNGKWLVLFSHPADFTPVCTTEFYSFQKHYDDFQKLNCDLLGLSIDQIYAHMKWVEWIKNNLKTEIKFPIIADNGDVAKRLGMIHPAKGTNTIRAVFIIDPKGTVRAILYYPQELGRNMDEILRMVKGLQVVSDKGVAMPANWPANELIGDHVIIPPPTDEKAARERQEKYDCYDWWFCHTKLK